MSTPEGRWKWSSFSAEEKPWLFWHSCRIDHQFFFTKHVLASPYAICFLQRCGLHMLWNSSESPSLASAEAYTRTYVIVPIIATVSRQSSHGRFPVCSIFLGASTILDLFICHGFMNWFGLPLILNYFLECFSGPFRHACAEGLWVQQNGPQRSMSAMRWPTAHIFLRRNIRKKFFYPKREIIHFFVIFYSTLIRASTGIKQDYGLRCKFHCFEHHSIPFGIHVLNPISAIWFQ